MLLSGYVAVPFMATALVVLMSVGSEHVRGERLADWDGLPWSATAIPPQTFSDPHPTVQKAESANMANPRGREQTTRGTVVVGGSLNGSLEPEESPWKNWLR